MERAPDDFEVDVARVEAQAGVGQPAPRLLVFCMAPGLIRGGQRNPAAASYPLDHFSMAHLEELLGDPDIRVAVGNFIGVDERAEARATQIAVAERARDELTTYELGGHALTLGEFVHGAGVLGASIFGAGMAAVRTPIPAAADLPAGAGAGAVVDNLGAETVASADGKPVKVESGDVREAGLQRPRHTR